jgi:hypothetical protein
MANAGAAGCQSTNTNGGNFIGAISSQGVSGDLTVLKTELQSMRDVTWITHMLLIPRWRQRLSELEFEIWNGQSQR